MKASDSAGLIVIGDELLTGKRKDKHLPVVIDRLSARGMRLAWFRMVGDDPHMLTQQLRQGRLDKIPVFCFGGIGATPDDQTRLCAALAFDKKMERNSEAVQLIEERFGKDAYPIRIRMAELPESCDLIPNPYNQIPGFSLYDFHFFPGFPQMAWPMLDWVMERYFPVSHIMVRERSVRLYGINESEMVEYMEHLNSEYSGIKIYSLPHIGSVNSIEMGVRGKSTLVDQAFEKMVLLLKEVGIDYVVL